MQNCKLSLTCRLGLLAISSVIVIFDQITKFLARTNMEYLETRPFLPQWNWVLTYNEGAAFSFLANAGGWQKYFFATTAFIVSCGLIYYILRYSYTRLSGIALSFVLGGAVGNLIDRLMHGKVTDFIDWYIGNSHWPAFNLADSFITTGVILIIIEGIFFAKKEDSTLDEKSTEKNK